MNPVRIRSNQSKIYADSPANRTFNGKKVSVIIPAYNEERLIAEAVDSALSQTYKDIEIIVVDDGSTDGTRRVLESYINSGKIKYIRSAHRGLSSARNIGIKSAGGGLIAFLDADDIFLPLKIEKQVEHLQNNPDCDVSYCGIYHFRDGEPRLLKLNYRCYSGKDFLPNLLRNFFIAPLSAVVRKSVFDRYGYFDENILVGEDFDFWARVAYGGAQICFLPENLGKLRWRRSGNLQEFSRQPELKLGSLRGLEKLYNLMNEEDRRRYNMRQHLMKYRLKTSFTYMMNGQKKEAEKFFLAAFDVYKFPFLGKQLFSAVFLLCPQFLMKMTSRFVYGLHRLIVLKGAKLVSD